MAARQARSTAPTRTRPGEGLTHRMSDDHQLAAELARGAGELLLALREQIGDAAYDPRALKDHGDAVAQEHLAARLSLLRPDDAVLSEEAKDSDARLAAHRVWIVDPLDGTKEYSERADGVWRDDWAVHVALWAADQDAPGDPAGRLLAGAVALPARGVVRSTPDVELVAPATGVWTPGTRPLRLAVSRSHPAEIVTRIAQHLDVELVPMGSAGVKAMAVVDGTVDAYVHGGGQYQWDSAAPVAVARAAGLATTRLDGTDLLYNEADPWLPDLIVCRPQTLPTIRTAIDAATVLEGPDK